MSKAPQPIDFFERQKLIKGSNLPPTERYILLTLNTYADAYGKNAYPGQATIADDTGYDRRTISRTLAKLRDKKVVDWETNGKRHHSTATNDYQIVFEEVQKLQRSSLEKGACDPVSQGGKTLDKSDNRGACDPVSQGGACDPVSLPLEIDDLTPLRSTISSPWGTGSHDLSIDLSIDLSSGSIHITPLFQEKGDEAIANPELFNYLQTEIPLNNTEHQHKPQSSHATVTVEPIAVHQPLITGLDSGEDKGSAPAKKARRKKKNHDVRLSRGSHSAYYPTEAEDLYKLWSPMYSALRGGIDSRAGFMQGFDALIEQDVPVNDILEGTCFYIYDKMQRLSRGKNPTVPPDAIRFFKGSRDHPSSYCLDALEHKRAQESGSLTPQHQAVMAIATETPPDILEMQRKELERRRRIEERERESREQNRTFWTYPPQR